jgi:hypothetical protein
MQSQLRTQLLEQLRKLAGPDAVRAAGTGGAGSDQARSMWHAALNCMLAEYLQASNCQFTLSVFNSETDTVPGQPAFSVDELCQLLRLDRQPQLLQRVQELLPSQGGGFYELCCLATGQQAAVRRCPNVTGKLPAVLNHATVWAVAAAVHRRHLPCFSVRQQQHFSTQFVCASVYCRLLGASAASGAG